MSIEGIKASLEKYKRKFYYRQLSKGLLLTLTFFIILFLGINSLESLFWFDGSTRLILLIVLLTAFLVPFSILVLIPALELFKLKQGISPKQMASDIGGFFPNIDDKLLNLLELDEINHNEESLISASIRQKEESLKVVDFSKAVNLKVNMKYLYGFVATVLLLGLLSFINPTAITGSTKRIIQFQNDFEKPMPFSIEILNSKLQAFKNEDFTVEIKLTGESIPQKVYLSHGKNRKVRLQSSNQSSFSYTWVNVQSDVSFQIEGAGFSSKPYEIKLINRPDITDFQLGLDYPSYTGISDETFRNIGSASIPEGTKVSWKLKTINTESATIKLKEESKPLTKVDESTFSFSKRILESQEYSLEILNNHGKNKTPINYSLEVVKDEFPNIAVEYLQDSLLFSSIIISGKIEDDYGFSKLRLFQKALPNGEITSFPIKFNSGLPEQNILYQWNPDSTTFNQSESVELWVGVWDNDAVNGSKKAVSNKFYFRKPNEAEIDKLISEKSNEAESKLNQAKKDSKQLNEKLDELQDRLKNKKDLGWQEQKLLKDIISKKEKIEESIEELKQKHEELIASQSQFDKKSEKLTEKSKQLQKLMEELLDDETKALYDELQKLLEEKSSLDEVSKQLSEINPGEKNLEKELERALELFKQLKLESKIEETAQKLEELGEEQENLSTEDSEQTQQEKQKEISEHFDEIKKDTDEIEELNQDLEDPKAMEDFNEQEEDIEKDIEEISEELDKKGPNKQSKSKQQNAGNKMKQMANKMKQMQEGMEMEMMQENMEHLRDILDNLIKTSFEQERIIADFKKVSQSDPRFLELSQDQLRLVQNSQIIEDSLRAIANRVLQISNFVTREIDQINRSLDNALDAIKERNKGRATSHQQFAMTSMNNLALLLDDVLQQMQMAMSKSGSGSKKGKKKGQTPSMSQLQKQLSQQIQDLKKSGKSGRKLSEELARMAAEQARIRKQLEELQGKLEGQNKDGEKGGSGDGLKEAIEKMEQNETDLVNKRLTQQLIDRQEDIISRMLETEKSMREQDQDNERKGETANQITRDFPPAFEEYLKTRQSEIELLNTIPLDLNPFYKKEVNKYFRKLSIQEN
ncbi:MAG: hypothetical protein JXR03_14840 [Cyclobacteriaceae bacterium]